MNSIDPSNIFGGTWTQITDRFLYCSSTSGDTGGSEYIMTANLRHYNHTIRLDQTSDNFNHETMKTIGNEVKLKR